MLFLVTATGEEEYRADDTAAEDEESGRKTNPQKQGVAAAGFSRRIFFGWRI